MKVTMDIECTPEEAREFFGLPDVKPLQDRALSELSERMTAAARDLDPNALLGQWMQGGTQGLEAMRNLLWPMATGAGPRDKASTKK